MFPKLSLRQPGKSPESRQTLMREVFVLGQTRMADPALPTDPCLPDSFLGEFSFRAARSNFAEAGG
jgi:hypothetical protein